MHRPSLRFPEELYLYSCNVRNGVRANGGARATIEPVSVLGVLQYINRESGLAAGAKGETIYNAKLLQ